MSEKEDKEAAAIVERAKVREAQLKEWHWDAMEDEQDLFTLARAVTALQAEVAAANAKLAEAEKDLAECGEYFAGRADAEYFPDSPRPVPTDEMLVIFKDWVDPAPTPDKK